MDKVFSFIKEPDEENVKNISPVWKILIVDDDADVHSVTKLVLKNFEFEGSGLEFYSAYNEQEAKKILSTTEDIALILLDVVMEEDDTGLKIAKFIREELRNDTIRIILRTGQPGSAPETSVIVEYDINDYKEKSELSARKLFSTIYTTIRSYRDLMRIKKNRDGLEKIIHYSSSLFEKKSFNEFSSGVLIQLSTLMRNQGNALMYAVYNKIACDEMSFEIIATTVGDTDGTSSQNIKSRLMEAIEKKEDIICDGHYVGYFNLNEYGIHLIYLESVCPMLVNEEKHLLNIFVRNITIAFQNIYLHKDLLGIQKELIYSMSSLAESRSKETSRHIRRVSHASGLLAKLMNLSDEEQEVIQYASSMHDIGKMGIPDTILLKPASLDAREFQVMKEHTKLGHEVFSKSNHRILRVASKIALSHHENYDGTGYPGGISGEDIPICARIVAVTDVFDALTHNRCYKEAWKIEEALQFIKEQSGIKFDPEITSVFLENIDQFLEIMERYKDDY